MEPYPWLEQLRHMEREDPWRRECLGRVQALTAGYEAACAGLTPSQRQAIEDYIAACEEVEHASVFLAYTLGKSHGVSCGNGREKG